MMLAVAVFVLAGVPSSYATLTYSGWTVFSGATQIPSGITATFTQNGPDHVTLQMSVGDTVPSSLKIDQWGFNYGGLNTDVMPTVLLIKGAPQATQIYNTWGSMTKANGDGYFNVYFYFPTNTGTTLSAGTTIEYELYASGLTENSFRFYTSVQHKTGTSDASYIGYYSAIHAIALPPDNLGSWGAANPEIGTSAPLPATAWLLGAGLLGLVVVRRRIKR